MCDWVVSEDPFLIIYCPNKYKTEGTCHEAADDCLVALKFILIGLLFHVNDDILFYNEDFNKVTFIKDIFWLYMLIKLILIMIIILIKVFLILLFMSHFWLGVGNLKNAKFLKKDKWRINASSVAT